MLRLDIILIIGDLRGESAYQRQLTTDRTRDDLLGQFDENIEIE